MELLVAANPDENSRLPYLIRLPLGAGLVFATSDVWPRTKALYCHRLDIADWPDDAVLVDRLELRSCSRRGAAVDIVAARSRENRSQLVHTMARGRQVVFWQSPKTRKQSRPGVRTPTARAAGIPELDIIVDAHERYPYTFADKPARTTRDALACGDYGLKIAGQLIAAVERKALSDFTSGVLNSTLKYQLTELAALPRAAVVVEERYSEIFALSQARPSAVADGLAELQISFPAVPIVFCQTRKLAQEYTYRYLAAALAWFVDNADAAEVFEPTPATPSPVVPNCARGRKASG
ncbi:hypothetical protein LAUMK41_02297 [Mycobacterium attenuatum]|nr:hypothetical protein LAUMK41_02297 [Mycobacterium attenuatum]